MPERIDGLRLLSGLGATLVLVSLFLDWFEPGASAWTVFELNDLVLAALALLSLGIVLTPLIWPQLRRHIPSASLPWLGAGALIIVVAALIQPPPAALHSSPELGAWLGLAGSLLMLCGGLLSGIRVSVMITLRSRQRGSAAPPPTEPPADPDTQTRPLGRDPGPERPSESDPAN